MFAKLCDIVVTGWGRHFPRRCFFSADQRLRLRASGRLKVLEIAAGDGIVNGNLLLGPPVRHDPESQLTLQGAAPLGARWVRGSLNLRGKNREIGQVHLPTELVSGRPGFVLRRVARKRVAAPVGIVVHTWNAR